MLLGTNPANAQPAPGSTAATTPAPAPAPASAPAPSGTPATDAAEPEAAAPTAEDVQEGGLVRPTGATRKPRTLEEIKKSGYIYILTRNNSTSFFIYRGHRMGFDYELGKRLAQQLGIRAEFVVPRSWNDLIPTLLRGEGDVIAGEVTVTPERSAQVRFAEPYITTAERIVYKKGSPTINAPEDLSGKSVKIRKSSSYWGTIEALNQKLTAAGKPPVEVVAATEDEETDDILDEVAHGKVAYTVADDLIANQTAAFLEDLVVGPALTEARPLAWAVRPDQQDLAAEIDKLFKKEKKEPEFNVLKQKYFLADREIKRRGKETIEGNGSLSPYDPMIVATAKKYGFDWRLMAAQIYQESRFDPKRKSWCGAQGLFQLMPPTAAELGIKDPFDPKQGIEGGANYMSRLVKHFDEVPDNVERYKMALASYNCGPGHVDDARKLLRDQKKPADTWADVATAMLQLSKEKVHGNTKYGYCRCGEPVDYVRHISERYDSYRQLVPETPSAPEPTAKSKSTKSEPLKVEPAKAEGKQVDKKDKD
jgi:membrane-bound lytic murein transglycosylase F